LDNINCPLNAAVTTVRLIKIERGGTCEDRQMGLLEEIKTVEYIENEW